jgi:hypothetical protein
VPPKFAFASASPSSVEPKETKVPRAARYHAKESQQDSDGWISVGPKHPHGRRSFTGDNNNDRRKFLQSQGGGHRKKNVPRDGNWRRRESRGEHSKGDVQQFQHQQHQQSQNSPPQLSSSPGSKFSSFFSGHPDQSSNPVAPPPGLSGVPPPGLAGPPPPFIIGPDGNPLPVPPFGNLPPPPPEFLQKFYNGEIPAPPSWN